MAARSCVCRQWNFTEESSLCLTARSLTVRVNGRWKDFRFTSFQCPVFCCIMTALCRGKGLLIKPKEWRNSWLIAVYCTCPSDCSAADRTHTRSYLFIRWGGAEGERRIGPGVRNTTKRRAVKNEEKDSLKLFPWKTPCWEREENKRPRSWTPSGGVHITRLAGAKRASLAENTSLRRRSH